MKVRMAELVFCRKLKRIQRKSSRERERERERAREREREGGGGGERELELKEHILSINHRFASHLASKFITSCQ